MSLPKLHVFILYLKKTLLIRGNPLDKRFENLLIPKNQNAPDLMECLQNSFDSTKSSHVYF